MTSGAEAGRFRCAIAIRRSEHAVQAPQTVSPAPRGSNPVRTPKSDEFKRRVLRIAGSQACGFISRWNMLCCDQNRFIKKTSDAHRRADFRKIFGELDEAETLPNFQRCSAACAAGRDAFCSGKPDFLALHGKLGRTRRGRETQTAWQERLHC